MHADVERSAGSVLEALRRGDASPLESSSTYLVFARFIGLQYMRTPGAATRWIEAMREVPRFDPAAARFDPAAAWGLIRTIFATNIGKAIFLSHKQTRLQFLECEPSTEFVTGDQPVINLGKTEHLELYYPLTPTRAMLLTPDQPGASVESITLSPDDVRRYNVLIRDAAMQQVYAASESALMQL
jgi:hypothetical protein